MALATLANSPTDEASLGQFSFANTDEHRKIIDAVRRLNGTFLQEFILDPISILDMGVWARQHQEAHNQMNQVLGTGGNDLTAVDFSQLEDVEAWVSIHFREHYEAAQILGLT